MLNSSESSSDSSSRQQQNSCDCKNRCATRKCSCKLDRVKCGTHCHPGRMCANWNTSDEYDVKQDLVIVDEKEVTSNNVWVNIGVTMLLDDDVAYENGIA